MQKPTTDLQGALNGNLAASVAALAGVAELASALRPTIGNEAVDRIADIMVERFRGVHPDPAFVETIEREIRERTRAR